jgi:hypothetical protein
MAEYLAHIHEDKFDGVKFSSAQNIGGMNVVLFGRFADEAASLSERFGVEYVADSITFSKTTGVQYSHVQLTYIERADGESVVYFDDHNHYDDDLDWGNYSSPARVQARLRRPGQAGARGSRMRLPSRRWQ